MKRGFPHGEREERADADSQSGLCAIDLFVTEEGAYTTVASAVAMLVVLALLFSAVSAVWSLSRSADVQAVADSAALAGQTSCRPITRRQRLSMRVLQVWVLRALR